MKGEKYLFVVSGPSGTGKDTVVAALLKKHPEIQHTVSATTRTPREGEKDGINYHFMSVADLRIIWHMTDVEHTKYCENYYGTLRSEIEGRMNAGHPGHPRHRVEGAGNIKNDVPRCNDHLSCCPRICRSSSAVCAAAAPRMRRPSSAA
mgnify:CR=1 FL=1